MVLSRSILFADNTKPFDDFLLPSPSGGALKIIDSCLFFFFPFSRAFPKQPVADMDSTCWVRGKPFFSAARGAQQEVPLFPPSPPTALLPSLVRKRNSTTPITSPFPFCRGQCSNRRAPFSPPYSGSEGPFFEALSTRTFAALILSPSPPPFRKAS